jgi:hypothetical protein
MELAKPEKPQEFVEVGDLWFEISQTLESKAKEATTKRASHWYSLALPHLSGLSATRVKKRIVSLPNEIVSLPNDLIENRVTKDLILSNKWVRIHTGSKGKIRWLFIFNKDGTCKGEWVDSKLKVVSSTISGTKKWNIKNGNFILYNSYKGKPYANNLEYRDGIFHWVDFENTKYTLEPVK